MFFDVYKLSPNYKIAGQTTGAYEQSGNPLTNQK